MLHRLLSPHLQKSTVRQNSVSTLPLAQAEPGGGRLTLHIPLLEGVVARIESVEDKMASRHPDGDADFPSAEPPKAVLELPVPPHTHHFFNNPIAGIEASCTKIVHRLVWEAGQACTHFACRWGGFALFAGIGIWAGLSQLRGRATLFNPGGHPNPAVGWTLLLLSLPLPVLPLAGAAVGEQAARLICRGLEPAPTMATGA